MRCAPSPARGPTWRSSARVCGCTRMPATPTSACPSTSRVRACTDVVTGARPRRARPRAMRRRGSWCAERIATPPPSAARATTPRAPVSADWCARTRACWRRRRRWRSAILIGRDCCAPIHPMACAWRGPRARGRCTVSWAPCCASVFRVGTPGCSPARRSSAEREGVSCYRVYDADMPEYAFAIDVYRTIEPDELWLYVQEYAAPAEIELQAVRRRRGEVLATLPRTTGVAPERIRVRLRRRGRRGEQYLGRPVQNLSSVGAT